MQPHLQGSATLQPREHTNEQAHDANFEQLQQQAAMLSNLPIVNKLLGNKEVVSRLASQSPMMSRMLALNPFMKDMLQPEAVTQLLQAAQDPQALQHLLGTPCLLTRPQLKLHASALLGIYALQASTDVVALPSWVMFVVNMLLFCSTTKRPQGWPRAAWARQARSQ